MFFMNTSWKCSGVSLGPQTLEGKSIALELATAFKGCTSYGFALNVRMNECKLRIRQLEALEAEHLYTSRLDILCPAGKSMEFEWPSPFPSPFCFWSIPSQEFLGSVKLTNMVGGTVKATFEVVPIKYFETGISNLCVGEGNYSNGALSGVVTLGATDSFGKAQPFRVLG